MEHHVTTQYRRSGVLVYMVCIVGYEEFGGFEVPALVYNYRKNEVRSLLNRKVVEFKNLKKERGLKGVPPKMEKPPKKISRAGPEKTAKKGVYKVRESERTNAKGHHVYIDYKCPVCRKDEFSKAGICDGWFTMRRSDFESGKLACRCSSSYRYTERQRIFQIESVARNLEFIGWVSGYEGKNAKTLEIMMRCQKHGDFITNFDRLYHKGCGCPECAGKNQKFSYIHLIEGEQGFKFGISKDPKYRISKMNSMNRAKAKNIGVWEFSSAEKCKKAEKECKKRVVTGFISKEYMKDGWTETASVLDLEKVIAIYEKHGGKRIK